MALFGRMVKAIYLLSNHQNNLWRKCSIHEWSLLTQRTQQTNLCLTSEGRKDLVLTLHLGWDDFSSYSIKYISFIVIFCTRTPYIKKPLRILLRLSGAGSRRPIRHKHGKGAEVTYLAINKSNWGYAFGNGDIVL